MNMLEYYDCCKSQFRLFDRILLEFKDKIEVESIFGMGSCSGEHYCTSSFRINELYFRLESYKDRDALIHKNSEVWRTTRINNYAYPGGAYDSTTSLNRLIESISSIIKSK